MVPLARASSTPPRMRSNLGSNSRRPKKALPRFTIIIIIIICGKRHKTRFYPTTGQDCDRSAKGDSAPRSRISPTLCNMSRTACGILDGQCKLSLELTTRCILGTTAAGQECQAIQGLREPTTGLRNCA
ncbi:hypothetical protein JDV02_007773 [Purpureocillium takamizusanense]|uniref:Uncharacterized protein n=1 Tax=Purpureocillium takamizusanense TaxID=2060973 RepID=A0A9Q8QNT1_9HYPO|nr:uncharacterized protein JDV02_007773 [Purpureocillium takamizusanense]UNI21817.1 hypothetical protein JDV02_007773 [Purpureocillium takamizusanense]